MLTSLSFFGWHRLRAIPILKRYNNVLWVSKSPLATKNLLEVTDGLRRPPF